MSLYDSDRIRQLQEELRRLEERAAQIRQQIQGMEYQKPREHYVFKKRPDWFSGKFEDNKK